jgi:hypothetical protein
MIRGAVGFLTLTTAGCDDPRADRDTYGVAYSY